MDEVAARMPELVGLTEFQLTVMNRGNLNFNFELVSPRCHYFLKAFGDRVRSEERRYRKKWHRYSIEGTVLEACEQGGVPAPRLIAKCDDLLLLVEEFVPGECLHSGLEAVEDHHQLLKELGGWLGGFHRLFEAVETDDTLAARARRHLHACSEATRRFQSGHDGTVERICQWLDTLRVERLVLCRNDCHLANFFRADEGSILGVDFELCSYQPAEMELGSLLLNYLRALHPAQLPERLFGSLPFSDFAAPLLEGYGGRVGRRGVPLSAGLVIHLLRLGAHDETLHDASVRAASRLMDRSSA